MRTSTILLLLLLPGTLRADKDQQDQKDQVDISPVQQLLAGVTDGKGHTLLFVPFPESKVRDHLYYGDGKVFHQLRYFGYSAQPGDFSYTLWDPRFARARTSLHFRKPTYTFHCGERSTVLRPLTKPETAALLGNARFLPPLWPRHAYALARDTSGRYYYVDRRREPENNRDFRLFVGPRGNLKLQRMKNVISDSEGDIFATRRGELRLILGKEQATWIQNKRRTALTLVPVDQNAPLIYGELGVYLGQKLGTPCDDL